jgi:putative DNA primase/helicase
MPKRIEDKVVPIKSGIDPALAAVLDVRDKFGLRLNKDRLPIGCLENVVTILLNDDAWQDVLAYNQFTCALEKNTPPPFGAEAGDWTDADDIETRLWLSQRYDMRATDKDVAAGVSAVGNRAKHHPVREYLDSLQWDGVGRINSWLVNYLGAVVPDDGGDLRSIEYYAKAGSWWLISAVARIYRPGCQADHVLLLEGRQGAGKSTALRMLFGEWFSDTPIRIGDKDSYGALRGVWGYELAELDSFNRAESSASKAFFSTTQDKYRPPYGKRDILAPRQNVFAGTTNHDQYLRDSTGNRRYWPVRCGEMRLRGEESLEVDADQLWAEAVVKFREGELWYPTSQEDVLLFGEQQAEREHGDVYESLIESKTGGITEVTMVEIFVNILEIEPAKMTRAEQIRVGEALKRLGWTKKRTGREEGRSYVYERELPGIGHGVGISGAGSVPF